MPVSEDGALLRCGARKQAWELDHTQLELGRPIGEGAFGRVFEGLLRLQPSGKQVRVAIKQPRASDKHLKEAMQEARIQRDYNHQNIVRLYGVCFNSAQFMASWGRDFLR